MVRRRSSVISLCLCSVFCLIALVGGAAADPIGLDLQVTSLLAAAPTLDPEVLRLALTARANAEREGLLKRPEILTIIDYALPSTEPRLWLFDLDRTALLHHELVAHGRGTGVGNYAKEFSNRQDSKQSSLGLFATGGTYQGKHGYSLHLHGLEPGVNDLAFDRTIVIHGAWYVSGSFAREHGRLGLSWGCPALGEDVTPKIIDQIKDGTALFVYYPDEKWLASSEFLVATAPAVDPPAETLRTLSRDARSLRRASSGTGSARVEPRSARRESPRMGPPTTRHAVDREQEGFEMHRSARLSYALALALFAGTAAIADDWPRFRGPNGSGTAPDENLPVEFSAATAAWTREVPAGQSSPIALHGAVFLTALDGDALVTAAYDARTGEEKWRRSVPRLRVDQIAPESGPAVPTPVADEAGVYSFFPEFGLVAYDFDGRERWRRELPPFRSFYGLASSPIIERGVLVLLCDQTNKPYILGVDPASGKELWRTSRDARAESWTTPVVHRAGTENARVLTFGSYAVDAYDPRTGELAWHLPGFGTTPVASPLVEGDLAFVVVPDQAAEFTPPALESFAKLDADGDQALDPQEIKPSEYASTFGWFDIDGDGKAALTEIARQLETMASPDFGLVAVDLAAPGGPRILWRERKTLPYIATPILYRGVLFLVKDGGILTSYEPKSGAILKRGRIEGATEQFFPSPVGAGGRLYLTSSTGTVAVVSAQAQWERLAVNDLDEPVFASPAIAGGRLFVRTRSKLYAFAGK